MPDSEIFNLGIPVLGICYGMQYIAHHFGGKVVRAKEQEFGKARLEIIRGELDSKNTESQSDSQAAVSCDDFKGFAKRANEAHLACAAVSKKQQSLKKRTRDNATLYRS